MRKIGLLLGALLISCAAYADNNVELKSSIIQGLNQQSHPNQTNPSILYTGEDISRMVIVTETGSHWTGPSSYIG